MWEIIIAWFVLDSSLIFYRTEITKQPVFPFPAFACINTSLFSIAEG